MDSVIVARAELAAAEAYVSSAHRRLTAACVGRPTVDQLEVSSALLDLEVALGSLYRARVAAEAADAVQGGARR